MRSELQKRILANILLDPKPEHVLLPRRHGKSISKLVSIALGVIVVVGFVLLIIKKVQA